MFTSVKEHKLNYMYVMNLNHIYEKVPCIQYLNNVYRILVFVFRFLAIKYYKN